jgi:hypothetical protein
LALSGAAAGDTRTVEAIGAVPYTEGETDRQAARRRALSIALRNAVLRVASDLVVADGGAVPSEPALTQALGSRSVEYAARYRIVEDRGDHPELVTDADTDAADYVVIARVEVDQERVRTRLSEAGFLTAREARVGGSTVRLEARGVESHAAYEALLAVVRAQPGVASVVPSRFAPGRVDLRVDTRDRGPELLSRLSREPPGDLRITPVRAQSDQIEVRVHWTPPAEGSLDSDTRPGSWRSLSTSGAQPRDD